MKWYLKSRADHVHDRWCWECSASNPNMGSQLASIHRKDVNFYSFIEESKWWNQASLICSTWTKPQIVFLFLTLDVSRWFAAAHLFAAPTIWLQRRNMGRKRRKSLVGGCFNANLKVSPFLVGILVIHLRKIGLFANDTSNSELHHLPSRMFPQRRVFDRREVCFKTRTSLCWAKACDNYNSFSSLGVGTVWSRQCQKLRT